MTLGRSGWIAAGLVAALAGGCRESKAPASAPDPAAGAPVKADSTDPLWGLAPAGVDVALVLADGAGASVQAGLATIVRSLEKSPVTAGLAREIREAVTVADIDPLDQAKLTAVGIDLARGAAFFMSSTGPVAVLPVGDRKKLLAAVGGKAEGGVDRLKSNMFCKEIAGRYACAMQAAQLDGLGKGGAAPVASWPAELRGHIELYAAASHLAGTPLSMVLDGSEGARVSARLERGGVTVRAHITGKPSGTLAGAQPGKSRLLADLAEQAPSGLLVLHGAALWKNHQAGALERLPAMKLPGEVGLDELVRSIEGDVVAFALPGSPERGIVRIGLTDPEPMKKLLGACDEIAAGVPAGVTIKMIEDRCVVSFERAALGMVGGAGEKIGADLWVDEKVGALVAGFGEHPAPSSGQPPLPGLAREVLDRPHLFALWAHGSIMGSASFMGDADVLAVRGMIATPILFWLQRLNEIGLAARVAEDGIHAALRVRTLWANPDGLVGEADKLFEEMAQGRADAAQALALAARHPGAPLAHDLQAGAGGFVLLAAPTGVLAAVAIPSFVAYQRRARTAEATVELRRLYTAVVEHVTENGQLPEAGAMTPPAGSCCAGPDRRCAPEASLWEGKPWRDLRFSMDDPHLYSYQLEVGADGKSFTVRATGDLDCDGTRSTYEMAGTIGDDRAVSPAPPIKATDELE
jgi:type II secretory pathway pseudopilin PulG